MAKVKQGNRFGPWEIISNEVSRGGNSRVWKVQHIDENDVTRAIKLLNPHRFGFERYQRFRDEVTFVLSNGNDGIMPILDQHLPESPSEEDRPWYVMPLATSISTLMDPSRSRLEVVVGILIPVAQTLVRLHGDGAAHRDIKPDNILSLDGRPVLSDFGLVDFPGKLDVTTPDERMGPALFVAPELLGDAADVDARPGDVYSFAKTLWVLAADKKWPLPGRLDIGDSRLRLGTYCSHAEVRLIEYLLDVATRTAPENRPTIVEMHKELTKWMELVSMPDDKKPAHLEDMKKRFAAFSAASRAKVTEHEESKKAANTAFDRLQPGVEWFLKQAASVAHGKRAKDWSLRKLPTAPGQSQTIVTRREDRLSTVNMTYGCYCQGAGGLFEALAVQIHAVAFADSTTEICLTLYLSTGRLTNRESSTPGIARIDANPPVPFNHHKTLWGTHCIEPTGSAALAATVKQISSDLCGQLEMALGELHALIQRQR
ncbi:protein kinase [Phycisphaerales bacterium AB-hyl4]|uniref:Protein kinase n=1 Tax=Natronomicrosphaera hydrolytica TaxID=3242702 RepID=A0ABV4U027_9BACT